MEDQLLLFDRVSLICPKCQMICGWNAKLQVYDAVRVESENPKEIQYAHRKCADVDED